PWRRVAASGSVEPGHPPLLAASASAVLGLRVSRAAARRLSVARAVVLFDGVCVLCDAFVRFVIARDRHGYFRFAAVQSAPGQALLARHGRGTGGAETVLLIEDDRVHVESTAALRILRKLRGAWPLLYVFILVPAVLRDPLYR